MQLQTTLQQEGDSAGQVESSESKLATQQQQALQSLIQQQAQTQSQMLKSVTQAEENAGLLAPAPGPAAESDWGTASSKQVLGQLGGNKGELVKLRKQEASEVQAQVTQEVTELDAAQNSAMAQLAAAQAERAENA